MHDNRGFLYQAVYDLFIYILSTVECVLMYCIWEKLAALCFHTALHQTDDRIVTVVCFSADCNIGNLILVQN